MNSIDPRKMRLIDEFIRMSKGKSPDDLLPLVLAISNKAKSLGITFTKDEIQQIVGSFKNNISPQEASQIDMIMNMLNF